MGIRELLDKQDGEFISLSDLLQQMAIEGRSSASDAAKFLRSAFAKARREKLLIPDLYVRVGMDGWEQAAPESSSAWRLLSTIADHDDPDYYDESVVEDSELEALRFGFLRSAIYDLLGNNGFALGRAVSNVEQAGRSYSRTGATHQNELKTMAASALEALGFSPIPDWMHPLIAMPTFQVREAACVLAGCDPLGYLIGDTPDPSVEADIARYKRLLLAAIAAGHLTGGNWSTDPTEQEVPHADLHDWCMANLQIWPIPSLKPFHTRDTELKERLRAAEVERDDLARQLRAAEIEIARLKSLDEMPGYRDITHDRYAPKLAAAIDAWESVADPQGKHPKQALVQWLTENAAKLGLWDKDRPNKTAIEEAAKVANWQERGGAPRTPG